MAYKTPKDVQERKDAKKRHILDTAARVFASRGYHGTTVKDIVDEAGISVGTFYFYFSSKEDIFDTLYNEMNDVFLNVIKEAVETIPTNPVESMCRAITSALLSFRNCRELAKIMLIESVGLTPYFEAKRMANNKRFSRILEDVLQVLNNKGIINVSSVQVAALALMGAIYTLIIDWLQDDNAADPVEFAYPLIIYNLQALKIDFDPQEIRNCIATILKENDKELNLEGDNCV